MAGFFDLRQSDGNKGVFISVVTFENARTDIMPETVKAEQILLNPFTHEVESHQILQRDFDSEFFKRFEAVRFGSVRQFVTGGAKNVEPAAHETFRLLQRGRSASTHVVASFNAAATGMAHHEKMRYFQCGNSILDCCRRAVLGPVRRTGWYKAGDIAMDEKIARIGFKYVGHLDAAVATGNGHRGGMLAVFNKASEQGLFVGIVRSLPSLVTALQKFWEGFGDRHGRVFQLNRRAYVFRRSCGVVSGIVPQYLHLTQHGLLYFNVLCRRFHRAFCAKAVLA